MQNDHRLKTTIASYNQKAADYVARNKRNNWWIGRNVPIDKFAGFLPPPAPVLEIGCGAGADVVNLRNAGYNVIGMDLSTGMLAQAREVAGDGLLQADMRMLPFAANSVDGVWAMASMLHLPRKNVAQTIAGIARVLRPNGTFFCSVKIGEGEIITHNMGERTFTLFQPDEMVSYLTTAGFHICEQWTWQPDNDPQAWLNVISQREDTR